MGYSQVDIANMALGHLGKTGIVSLTETSAEARACNFWYGKAARQAKVRSNWTFDRAIQTLASLDNNYAERWAYRYDIPGNAVDIVRLVPTVDPVGEPRQPPVPFQRLGGSLYCNVSPAKADILTNAVTPGDWPENFSLAVSHLMARHMAPTLTRKGSMLEAQNQFYEYYLALAVEADAGQEPSYYAYESQYLTDRRGSEGSGVDGSGVDGSIYWS
jgi:hypothetical protein